MIKAIETRYKGYRFRSRLEARFAIFFDQMGIEWEYEPEGFELPITGRYLPDFFIKCPEGSKHKNKWPNAGYWVEVKGGEPTKEEAMKLAELQKETGHIGWFFYNGIGKNCRSCTVSSFLKEEVFGENICLPGTPDNIKDKIDSLIQSGKSIIRSKDAGELWCCAPVTMCSTKDEIKYFYPSLFAARSARFEHGETPA